MIGLHNVNHFVTSLKKPDCQLRRVRLMITNYRLPMFGDRLASPMILLELKEFGHTQAFFLASLVSINNSDICRSYSRLS